MASKSSGSSSRSAVREALTGGTTPKDKGPPVADGVLSTESTTDAIASPLDVERPCFLDDEAEEGRQPATLQNSCSAAIFSIGYSYTGNIRAFCALPQARRALAGSMARSRGGSRTSQRSARES